MTILVIGSGGREHALVWKLNQSPKVTHLFVAPGNPGTAHIATNVPLTNIEDILSWIDKNPVDLVVVGPDQYLADGIVDQLRERHIRVFGPTRAAAEIEWSKTFAKQFMFEEGIPTAAYQIFSDILEAKKYIQVQEFPLVIKANGLAAGKGVVVASDLTEAETALSSLMEDRIHGDAGDIIIIEEYLIGMEISIHALCDGTNAVLFPVSQDHKRIYDGNSGPNTGGMGTVAPLPNVTEAQIEEINDKIVIPTLAALRKRGRPFTGILFPGIILTAEGPKVIEFNARFGDPETQSYMRLLKTDLLQLLLSSIEGTVSTTPIEWSDKTASCIVLASGGYPGSYHKGIKINGIEQADRLKDIVLFHAGTKMEGDAYFTHGGRVLNVTSTGDTLDEALRAVYAAIENINFEGMQFRKDIGKQACFAQTK